MATAYITHPSCGKHAMSSGHPECPQRIEAVEQVLQASGLLDQLVHLEAPNAILMLAHESAHVERVIALAPDEAGKY